MSDVLRLRAGTIDWREVDGEIVALEGERSLYLTANPAGTLLWRALARGATRDDLVAELQTAYALDAQVAARDVDAFLEQAREHAVLDG